MQKGENYNHPVRGRSTKVAPIREMEKIRAIENLLAHNPRNLALFTLGVNTPLKPQELLDIRVGQIQNMIQQNGIEINGAKKRDHRSIKLNESCIKVLQDMIRFVEKGQRKGLDPDAWIFMGQRGPLSVPSLNILIKQWCTSVGLEGNYGGQTLRKTYGYQQLTHFGQGLSAVKTALNQGSPLQTLEYLCLKPEDLKNLAPKRSSWELGSNPKDLELQSAALKKEIQDLKKAMEKSWENEEKFKTFFEYANDALIYMDDAGYIVEVNDITEDIFGWSRKEARGKHFSEFGLLKPDFFEDEAFRGFDESVSNIPRAITEIEVFRRDGTAIFIEVSTKSVKKDGEIKGVVCIVRDATERKRMEKALQESEQKARALLNATTDAVMLLDEKGTILDTNRAYAAIFGREIDETIGLCFWDLVPRDLHDLKKVLDQAIQTGSSIRLVKEFRGVWMDSVLYPIVDMHGTVSQIAVFSQDITKRKEAEASLLQHRDHLEELVKERTVNLEQTNTALKVLLKRRQEDRAELEEKMVLNVRELVLPFLEELKNSRLTERQMAISDILERHLNDIITPFVKTLSSKYYHFTPIEIRIANLIRQGKSTKEIASHLNLSSRTIDHHRYHIRKKLGINKEKANLATHLLSME